MELSVILSALVITFFLILAGMVILPAFWGSPWHPLAPWSIRKILDFAEIRPGDKIYDLGSGDGRVLIAAARDHGAVGTGVEIDPLKVWISRMLARWFGVSDRVRIIRKNIFDCDCSDADLVYLYLTHSALDRIFPSLASQLRTSARIVTYRFCLRGVKPVKIHPDGNLFLYRFEKGMEVDRYT